MANFKITPATSVFTNSAGDHAFDDDTAGADTLTVDASAFLITAGASASGALLKNTGAWKVTVNGSIVANQHSAIALDQGNAAISTFTIGEDGEVSGNTGMTLGSSATIKNAGIIRGTDYGIFISGPGTLTTTITNSGTISGGTFSIWDWGGIGISNDKITNTGTLTGSVDLREGVNALTNSGRLTGNYSGGNSEDTVVNSGFITGGVALNAGNNTLTNSGTIGGGVGFFSGATSTNKVTNSGTIIGPISGILSDGADTVINSGSVTGPVLLGEGNNALTNSGTIGENILGVSYVGGAGADTVTNSKLITGSLELGEGTNKLTNSGTIEGDVIGGTGVDTIVNTGTMLGSVLLGNGDDKYTGGNLFDTVSDSNGSETINLGGEDDEYVATGAIGVGVDGTDIVDGGAGGADHYYAGSATNAVLINLDTVQHGTVAANTATGADVAGAFKDTIKNFEDATGGSASDTIHGSAAANRLQSGGGGDLMFGYAGTDSLTGEGGTDFLNGGAGRDFLFGGADTDYFVYQSIADSGPGKKARDLIMDFDSALDLIDLQSIDANTTVANDQAFTFIGTNVPTGFSGAAGELRAYWSATGQIIEGDVNGDKKADFSIEIADPNHLIVLDAGDFLL